MCSPNWLQCWSVIFALSSFTDAVASLNAGGKLTDAAAVSGFVRCAIHLGGLLSIRSLNASGIRCYANLQLVFMVGSQ